jgi:hypothetical protein
MTIRLLDLNFLLLAGMTFRGFSDVDYAQPISPNAMKVLMNMKKYQKLNLLIIVKIIFLWLT